MPSYPYIPASITVHLGSPGSSAQNVTLPFRDYIANVASSEIYPTWPENAIRANIYAQISFALNRFYTEYYRSRGYDFDITNSTAYDQAFVNNREIFENIGRLVGEIFDTYIYREGAVEPLFAQYCNGTTVTCAGLSQWGSVELARQGMTPFEILQYYYGDDINLSFDTPVETPVYSLPYRSLRPGEVGEEVRSIQIRLNRISVNYPSIPKIYPINGIYALGTEDAVREFQRIFDLTVDGIVGKSTWYKIIQIFNGVKRLNELDSEGLALGEIERQFPETLREGDSGIYIKQLQYFLAVVAENTDQLPSITIDSIFGQATRNAVEAFQRLYAINVTGVVDAETWNTLFNVYRGIVTSAPEFYSGIPISPYPGYALSLGMQGNEVRLLQGYLSRLSEIYPQIPPVEVSGVFGTATRDAVYSAQRLFGLPIDGIVRIDTWNAIADAYRDLIYGEYAADGQFGGSTLSER